MLHQGLYSTKIKFSFRLDGWHSYPKASGTHQFLEHRHRHLFFFKIQLSVNSLDREIEFLDARADAILELASHFHNNVEGYGCDFENMSCERIANWLLGYLLEKYGEHYIMVECLEDGENGADISYKPSNKVLAQ